MGGGLGAFRGGRPGGTEGGAPGVGAMGAAGGQVQFQAGLGFFPSLFGLQFVSGWRVYCDSLRNDAVVGRSGWGSVRV